MGTLDSIGKHLTLAIKPVKDGFSTPEQFEQFIYRLGWGATGIPASYTNLVTKVNAAVSAMEALIDDPSIEDILSLFGKIKDVYQAFRSICDAPPGISDPAAFLNEIKDRLFEILFTDYLAAAQPTAYNVFKILGAIEPVYMSPGGGRPNFVRNKLDWDAIGESLKNPDTIPERVYGWGTNDFDFRKIAGHLLELFTAVSIPASIKKINDDSEYKYLGFLDDEIVTSKTKYAVNIPFSYINISGETKELGLAILKMPAIDGNKPGIIIQPNVPSEISATLPIRDDVNMTIKGGSNIAALFGLVLTPDEIDVRYPFEDGTLPDFGFGISIDYSPESPKIIFGSPSSTRLEMKGVSGGFEFNFKDSKHEIVLNADLKELALVIKIGDGDGFIQELLGGEDAKISIDLGVEWSSERGIRFKGGGGFEVSSHPHLSLGPISIEEFQLALKAAFGDDTGIKLETGVSIKAELGPLVVTVQGIGMNLNTTFRNNGNAGPFDIDIGFKPPNGVGIVIDVSVVKGGGYLFFDNDKDEYAGALELTIQDTIALKAIGIVNTKMPDGSKGFSLLILVTAEFSPIQLGYGFTLIGVGGLLGLNRTMIVEKLQSGIKDNSIKSIMFPENVIANITRIISNIKQVFPPYKGHFIIGPMGKIGWGTPTLISLELGLVIEIPDPKIAILGVLKSVLPDEKVEILRLQVNFLGVIDFGKKEISFDAYLFNSKLLIFTLTGQMALRINWGNNPTFLLSVGGFHPEFKEIPQGLVNMARLAIRITSGNNPRIGIECYFAVTSNTVQFGAKAELYAAACGFNIYGWLGFDILFQFKPFFFIAMLYAGLALRRGSSVLMGIDVSMRLSGPTPWHAKGKASFRIIFKFTISFDKTWGDSKNDEVKELEDVMKLLKEAVEDDRNWLSEIPSNNSLNVTTKKIQASNENEIIVHPFGVLSFSQRVVPLKLNINKFGHKLPKDANYFEVKNVKSGAIEFSTCDVKDKFAVGNFIELTDDKKLSRKSFEDFNSGKKLSGTAALKSGTPVEKIVDYELSYLKKQLFLFVFAGVYRLLKSVFSIQIKASSVAQSKMSYAKNKPSANAPMDVSIYSNDFVVARIDDMAPIEGLAATTQTEAFQLMDEFIANNPEKAGQVQVLAMHEMMDA